MVWPHENGVVGPREVHHLELQSLGLKVGGVSKRDGQGDLLERVGLVAGDDAVK